MVAFTIGWTAPLRVWTSRESTEVHSRLLSSRRTDKQVERCPSADTHLYNMLAYQTFSNSLPAGPGNPFPPGAPDGPLVPLSPRGPLGPVGPREPGFPRKQETVASHHTSLQRLSRATFSSSWKATDRLCQEVHLFPSPPEGLQEKQRVRVSLGA